MKQFRCSVVLSAISFAAISGAQTLPPPAFNSGTYWFGPGPSPFLTYSNLQSDGAYSEMYFDQGSWFLNPAGTPVIGFTVSPNASTSFRLSTTVIIEPYIYVDGYFTTTATFRGFSTAGPINSGTSRFYVVHNVPVLVTGDSFTTVGLGGPSGAALPTTYRFDLTDYVTPSNYSATQSAAAGSSDTVSFSVDNAVDDGILQVDVTRSSTVPVNAMGGTYSGTGRVTVSSV